MRIDEFDNIPCFQVVIIDTNPIVWQRKSESSNQYEVNLVEFSQCLSLFCNSHFMMNRKNRICIISQNGRNVHIIHPTVDNVDKNFTIPSSGLSEILVSDLINNYNFNTELSHTNNTNPTGTLSQALSRALCSK